MPAVLSAKTQDMLADMPSYLRDDPAVQSVVEAGGKELAGVEAFLVALGSKLFPHNADDEHRTLGLWEWILGIPVEPVGVSVEVRRAVVLANYRGRKIGSGARWVELVTAALGTALWTHEENTPLDYQLKVEFPVAPGGYSLGQLDALLARVTPAHIQPLASATPDSFLVDLSRVDVDDLGA